MSDPTLTREAVAHHMEFAAALKAQREAGTELTVLQSDIVDFAALCRQLGEALQEFGTHDSKCVLSRWCAGRPTKSGVYENLFGDKWYPKGEEPECTCGLSAALALMEGAPDGTE